MSFSSGVWRRAHTGGWEELCVYVAAEPKVISPAKVCCQDKGRLR